MQSSLKKLTRYTSILTALLAVVLILYVLNQANHQVSVVQVLRQVPVGTTITSSDIGAYTLKGTEAPPGTILWDNRSSVIGEVTTEALVQNELINPVRLMTADGKNAYSLTDVISSPDNRIACIPVDTTTAATNLGLQQGNFIDVVGTFDSLPSPLQTGGITTAPGANPNGSGNKSVATLVTSVIIQHAKILNDPAAGKNCARVEVTPDQEAELVFLKNYGTLDITVERPDGKTVDTQPMTLTRLQTILKIPTSSVPVSVADQSANPATPFTPNITTTTTVSNTQNTTAVK